MRPISSVAVIFFVSLTFSQNTNPIKQARNLWEPPTWQFPENIKASVPKEMISALHVTGFEVRLEETTMKDAQRHLGGEIGTKGDAAEALKWLCYHGRDDHSPWVLWLESGEMDADYVGTFQWQRLTSDEVFAHCREVSGPAPIVTLSVSLGLGANEADVLTTLGPPSFGNDKSLIYFHEHDLMVRGKPYTASNVVAIHLRNGLVWAILVSKSTSS